MKTLSDHILDIVQNSIVAGATLIEIIVEENKKNDICVLSIEDNGRGMNLQMLKQASNPFFTTRKTRKVGLGLALLKQNAQQSNGSFKLDSVENKGTKVTATFQYSNVDKPGLGDVWDSVYLLLMCNENLKIIYQHKTDKGAFKINSTEIKELLGGISIKQKEIREAIVEMIKNNIKEIQ